MARLKSQVFFKYRRNTLISTASGRSSARKLEILHKGGTMLNHIVLIKFKKDAPEEDIQDLENLLEELPNKILEIHSFEFGRDIIHSDRSYDFALVSLFANIESLQRYQVHPEHQSVLKKMKSISESVFCVDFMGTEASDFKEKTPDQGVGTW